MKGKAIIGLVLAAGLLLIGSVAYAHWNDYGDRGNYGTGYESGCGYGHVYGAGYNTKVNDPAIKTYTPCYGYRQGNGNQYAHDNRHGYGNGWTGRRDHGRMGPRGCW
jgi:hypothetical protein